MTMTENDAKTWNVCADDIPGPLQVSRVKKALQRLYSAGRGQHELHGVRGRPNTHRILTKLGMGEGQSEASRKAWDELGEAHGWTISRKNANAVKKAAEAAAQEVREAMEPVDMLEDPEVYDKRHAESQARMAENDRKFQEQRARAEASHAAILAKRPPRAAALIVAELHEDQSDSMTDYFSHTTTRRVVIGWRTGQREDFRQLRRAAAGFGETAHLGPDADDSVEHRENYSMGGGNYLKGGSRHCSGWAVKSYPIAPDGTLPGYVRELEDGIPDPAPVPADGGAPAASSGEGYTVQESTNKRGAFWLVVLADRVDRSTFEELRASAKAAGGWYSRAWRGVPGGFGFSSREDAEDWAESTIGGSDGPPPLDPEKAREKTAEHLEGLAASMQEDIDHKRAPLSQNWTPRRARIKDGQRQEADHLERVQRGLSALAAAHRENRVPPALAGIETRKAVADLVRQWHGEDVPEGTRFELKGDDAKASALRQLVEEHTTDADRAAAEERKQADELRELEDRVRDARIPGFFPTPEAVVLRMLEAADIDIESATCPECGSMEWLDAGNDAVCAHCDYAASFYAPWFDFLEPSAGIGSIAEPLRAYVNRHGGSLTCVEINYTLCEILRTKGFENVQQADFTEWDRDAQLGTAREFGRILMNPPFERKNGRQDLHHIIRASRLLAPDGKLVALCTPATARMLEQEPPEHLYGKAQVSRCAVEVEELPEGSFSGAESFRQTGVSVCMVTITRTAS